LLFRKMNKKMLALLLLLKISISIQSVNVVCYRKAYLGGWFNSMSSALLLNLLGFLRYSIFTEITYQIRSERFSEAVFMN